MSKALFNFAFVFKDSTETKVKVWTVEGFDDRTKEYELMMKDRALEEVCWFDGYEKKWLFIWDMNRTTL